MGFTAGRSRGYLASAESIRQARIELAAKMGYEIDDDSSIETTNIVKHPHQVFAGIEPGWVVNLADRTLMKPTDSRVLAYYNRGVLST
jgi:large subunit ribosomal protein L15